MVKNNLENKRAARAQKKEIMLSQNTGRKSVSQDIKGVPCIVYSSVRLFTLRF